MINKDIPEVKIYFDEFVDLLEKMTKEYGIPGEINKLRLHDICTEIVWYEASGDADVKNSVELLLLLKTSLENKTGIRVSNLKGISVKCDYYDFGSIYHIIRMLETKLFFKRAVYYDDVFRWDILSEYDFLPEHFEVDFIRRNWSSSGGWFKIFNAHKSPYSISQLQEILEHEKNLILYENDAEKNKKPNKIIRAVNLLKAQGNFRTDIKTIATNEACFIYDLMEASAQDFEPSPLPLTNQEKYQYIKRIIKK